jgi:hypothetical protein
MAAKQVTTNRRKALKRPPSAYRIEVNVDVDGNFKYSADGIPDASSIRPHNGDTISWSAKLMGAPVPFQVEFPDFGPFDMGTRVVRSMFQPTAPLTVAVPSYYHGNLVFKYTVTIVNGWSDDPDVEPVPSDGVNRTKDTQVISLSIDGAGNLVLDNPDISFSRGEVAWKWAGSPLDDFSLTFDAPVPGWPLQANSQSQRIALDLETPGSQHYTIQTLHLGLSVRGRLTIH